MFNIQIPTPLCIDLYWNFNYLLVIFCFHFLTSQTTKLQLFIKQRMMCKLWTQPSFHLIFFIVDAHFRTPEPGPSMPKSSLKRLPLMDANVVSEATPEKTRKIRDSDDEIKQENESETCFESSADLKSKNGLSQSFVVTTADNSVLILDDDASIR